MTEDHDNVSLELLRRQLNEERRKSKTLPPGDGDGTYDDMKGRIKVLEYRADASDQRLSRIEDKLDRVLESIARIDGKLSDMPTRSFVILTVAAIVGLVIAAIAAAPYLRLPVTGA